MPSADAAAVMNVCRLEYITNCSPFSSAAMPTRGVEHGQLGERVLPVGQVVVLDAPVPAPLEGDGRVVDGLGLVGLADLFPLLPRLAPGHPHRAVGAVGDAVTEGEGLLAGDL